MEVGMDVRIENIQKVYNKGEVKALDSVSFSIDRGELFGLVGPDGAGKTSLFRILTTLLLADGGNAYIKDYEVVKDYRKIRKIIGYMPGRFSLYQDLSVEENLAFFASLFGTDPQANYDLIADIYDQIAPFKSRPAGKLSGGMKQKLALCCALIHRPKVLFLDEPTTGVDAVSRKEFWDILQGLKKEGITILVSTPYMDEAKLCERIALLQEGKLLSVDSPAQIRARYPHPLYSVSAQNMGLLLKDLRTIPFVDQAYSFGASHHIQFVDDVDQSDQLALTLSKGGHQAVEIKKTDPTIEDCFIQLMDK